MKKQDLELLGRSYRLNEAQIRNAFKNILGRKKEMIDFIGISFLTDDYKAKYVKMLKARCRVLA